jgi:hypothetical protein
VIRESSHALQIRRALGALLGAVRFDVLLGSMLRMVCGMNVVGVCQVRVMVGFL